MIETTPPIQYYTVTFHDRVEKMTLQQLLDSRWHHHAWTHSSVQCTVCGRSYRSSDPLIYSPCYKQRMVPEVDPTTGKLYRYVTVSDLVDRYHTFEQHTVLIRGPDGNVVHHNTLTPSRYQPYNYDRAMVKWSRVMSHCSAPLRQRDPDRYDREKFLIIRTKMLESPTYRKVGMLCGELKQLYALDDLRVKKVRGRRSSIKYTWDDYVVSKPRKSWKTCKARKQWQCKILYSKHYITKDK